MDSLATLYSNYSDVVIHTSFCDHLDPEVFLRNLFYLSENIDGSIQHIFEFEKEY